ncbi:MAG TPA: DUF4097 family beta strand repeat-containing protein [Puia sp.]|nr:DUF4097 family beta strand repeat-containing protein [Puia sp.]
MKKLLLYFAFAAIYYASSAQSNSSDMPFLIKDLKSESFGKINAETTHGNISVSIATGDPRIEVYIHSNHNDEKLTKEETQKRLSENYTLEVSVSHNQLNAIAKQKNIFKDWRNALSISFVIYAPKSAATKLRTSHGNIDLSGMQGNQELTTSHGNIGIENITGKISGQTSHGNISVKDSKDEMDLSTSHGNIDATNSAGIVKLTTSSGNIELKNLQGKTFANTSHGNVAGNTIEGELSATTSHGDVALDNLSCSVETSTSHGNIVLSMNKITGKITADNSDGNISVQLPKGKGINLDLQGKRVSVESMENFSGKKENETVKGTLNGGGEQVTAKTSKGSVSITFK